MNDISFLNALYFVAQSFITTVSSPPPPLNEKRLPDMASRDC